MIMRWYIWVVAGAILMAGFLPAKAYIDGSSQPFADQPLFSFALFGAILGGMAYGIAVVVLGVRRSQQQAKLEAADLVSLKDQLETPADMQQWAREQPHIPNYWGFSNWSGVQHRGLCLTMYDLQTGYTETFIQKPAIVHYALTIVGGILGALASWGAVAASHSDQGVDWYIIFPILVLGLGGAGWVIGWGFKALFAYDAAWAHLMLMQYEIVLGGIRQVIGYTRARVPRLAFVNEPSPFWGSHQQGGFAHGFLVMGTTLTHDEIMDQGMDILWTDQVEIFHMADFVEGKIRANAEDSDYFEAEREGFHYANTKWMQALAAKAERRGELKRQRMSKPRNKVAQMVGYGMVIFVLVGCSMWQACTGYQSPQDQYETVINSFQSSD